MFAITDTEIRTETLTQDLLTRSCGAVVSFEGRVRDHNLGKRVVALEYEIYPELALKEGKVILEEARSKFNIVNCASIHRFGKLELTDVAVSVVVVASHRDEAFLACRYIIDEIKVRLPIWKKEHYSTLETAWVECAGCKKSQSSHVANKGKELESIF